MSYEGIDFLLNPCGDTAIDGGDLVQTTGADVIRQMWLIRVRTYKGEWILDLDHGVPYVQEVFQKIQSKSRLEEIFRDITLGTPGVIAIESIQIGDIDPINRHLELTVEAVIEGPESVTFHYDSTLDLGACTLPSAANLPLTIEGLRAWFDAQDLGALTYNSPLNMQNKAATGDCDGDVTLEGVSDLGNKRSVFFDNDLTQTKEMDILDTPAIRHGDGSMSVFIVTKQKEKTSYSGTECFGLLSLDGYDVTSGQHEFYDFSICMDGSTPNTAQPEIKSGRVGGTIETSRTVTTIENFNSVILQFDISSAGEIDIYANGVLIGTSQ